MQTTFLGERQEHFKVNSRVYHQPELVSLAILTIKGEEDGLEPG